MHRAQQHEPIDETELIGLLELARRLLTIKLWRSPDSTAASVCKSLRRHCQRGSRGLFLKSEMRGSSWVSSVESWRAYCAAKTAVARKQTMPVNVATSREWAAEEAAEIALSKSLGLL